MPPVNQITGVVDFVGFDPCRDDGMLELSIRDHRRPVWLFAKDSDTDMTMDGVKVVYDDLMLLLSHPDAERDMTVRLFPDPDRSGVTTKAEFGSVQKGALLAVDHGVIAAGGRPRSPEWPKYRMEYLKTHRTCTACGGSDHLEVHHKKPFHLYPELELEPSNYQTLCEHPARNCHFRIGHGFRWAYYNPNSVEDGARELSMIMGLLSRREDK